jgi:DNA-binding transcriptional regulator YiaG
METDRMVTQGRGAMTAAEFKTRREAVGATQQWVAKSLGRTVVTIKRWESGKCPVPDAAAALIEGVEEWGLHSLADLRATLEPPGCEPAGGLMVVLTRYRTESAFRAAFEHSKYSAAIHGMWVAAAREALVREGFEVLIRYDETPA